MPVESKSDEDFRFRFALNVVYTNLYYLCANLTGYEKDGSAFDVFYRCSDEQAWDAIEASVHRARRVARSSANPEYQHLLLRCEAHVCSVAVQLTRWRLVRKEPAGEGNYCREPVLSDIASWKDILRNNAHNIMITSG